MPPVCLWMPFAVSFTSKPTTASLPQPRNPIITAGNLAEAYLQMYDPRRDSEALKTHPEQFEKLRETTRYEEKKMLTLISQSSTYI